MCIEEKVGSLAHKEGKAKQFLISTYVASIYHQYTNQ